MNTLYLQLATAFIVGGLLISLQTLLGERVPPFWRGMILTVPTTMSMGFFFIGLAKSPLDVAQAITIIPAGLGLDYFYVMIFAALSSFGLWISTSVSVVVWILYAALLLRFPPANFIISLVYGLPVVLVSYAIVSRMTHVHTLKAFPMNARHILVRSVMGGIVIMLIVLLSKTLGNTWGGLFAVFPATFSSTLFIYYIMQGRTVIPAVVRSFFFPGSLGFIIYASVAAYTFPPLGIWIGTLLSYVATFLFFALYSVIAKRVLRFRPDLVQ